MCDARQYCLLQQHERAGIWHICGFAFCAEQNINFPLLSDFNKTASRAYESIYDHWFNDMEGVSKRSAFVIDKEGIVRYAEVLENASDIPDFKAIQTCLETINH